jgi:SSS family solute:Na+ symporter
MSLLDILIVVTWSLFTLYIGMRAGAKESFDGFWVNNRKTKIALLVFTIVATQIGGGTIIGIASSTYKAGTGFGLVALISTLTGFLAMAWLAPAIKRFGNKTKAFTLPEILAVRYGRSTQIVAGIVIVLAYLAMLAGQLVATGVIIQIWSGWSFYIALAIAAIGVIVYSAYAGLKGDIATDVLHFWFMAIAMFAVLLPIVLFKEPIGHILSSLTVLQLSPVTFGGYTYLIAGVIFGILIPLVSIELWLRVFAAENEKVARKAYIWSAISIVPFYILPILLGLLAIKTMPNLINSDFVFIDSLFHYLPHGLLGLGVASLFATVISTANTMIVVLGATFYRDVLGKPLEGGILELKQSRYITLAFGVLGVALSALMPNIVQLILSSFFIIAVILPALVSVPIWKRATPLGATLSIALGALTTITFLPSMPTQAFVPGMVVAILVLIVASLVVKPSATR